MVKTQLISFTEYQESLFEKGMAIAAECSHEGYGEIIFHEVVENPSSDLLTMMREKALEALVVEFHEFYKLHQGQKSDSEYLEVLVNEFEEAKDLRFTDYSKIDWLDKNNPKNGVMLKVSKNPWSKFELRVSPNLLPYVWENELAVDIDKDIFEKVQREIEDTLEELEVEVDPDNSRGLEWCDMIGIDSMIYPSCPSEAEFKKIKSSFMIDLLSPIFNNYEKYHLYIASPDTTYRVIGRPDFYPIIAAERSDGSYEVTIFNAYNS